MDINRYFGQPFDFDVPRRVFARSVDFEPRSYEIFDAVDADWLDTARSGSPNVFAPEEYGRFVQEAPIYTIEVSAEPLMSAGQRMFETPWAFAADRWLDDREKRGEWVELAFHPNDDGPAQVFESAESAGRRVDLSAKPIDAAIMDALKQAVDLDRFKASDEEILRALPRAAIDGVVVLDVGQGGANAIVSGNGAVVAYFDLGAGTRNDRGTWPQAMQGFCLEHAPPIILSHWHEDHFHGANKFPQARGMTWIAPMQALGPGPQTAMANAVAQQGALLVWAASQGSLRRGSLHLERCVGPSSNMNRYGIALWVEAQPIDRYGAPLSQDDAILLPGDASYGDIPGLAATPPRPVHSFVVAHHGGAAAGKPPACPNLATRPRAALSYGPSNRYRHPLHRSLVGLRTAGWHVGHPAAPQDDPRTEDRTRKRGAKLGHIGLNWGRPQLQVSCTCGATVRPHQY